MGDMSAEIVTVEFEFHRIEIGTSDSEYFIMLCEPLQN